MIIYFMRLRSLLSLSSIKFYPELYKNIFVVLSFIWIVLYAIILFGLWNDAIFYLNMLNYYYRLYLAGTLLYFFNPWREMGLDGFHRSLIFSTALFLIASTTITDFVIKTKEVTQKVKQDAGELFERITPTTATPHTTSVRSFL